MVTYTAEKKATVMIGEQVAAQSQLSNWDKLVTNDAHPPGYTVL